MFVCVCNAITEAQVRESVAAGADTLEALQLETGLGSCCGTCTEVAGSYLPGGACAKASAPCAATHCATPAYRTTPPARAPSVHTPGLAGCAPVRWVSRAPHAPRALAKAA